ncbi:MAG: acyl-CoA dehydrogenase family protein [Dehalococcoidia bacterium]|nr:MAG: acyl-CoA dehydrogenase family protein [Dehalococcoidia bacterium]
MDFGFTEQEEALREEIREFLLQELGPKPVGRTPRELFNREFTKKMAAKGWLGVGWPTEYGGLGRPYTEQLVFFEEMLRSRAPQGAHILAQNMVGPTLIRVGNEEQKREYLPRILRGEVVFCLGYTEPNAGSDLANCQTTGVLDGDEWVINGQKMFTSFAGQADYTYMTVRTDPDAPKKHRGISMFIVDMKTPGITVSTLDTMWDYPVYEVFFDNVRVSKNAVVGELNQGWHYLTTALDHERVFMGGCVAVHSRLFEEVVNYAKSTYRNGKPVSENPIIRQRLAQLRIDLEIGRLFSYRVAWLLGQGIVPFAEASMTKIFTSELEQRLANTAMQVLGLYGPLDEGHQAPLDGYIGWEYKFSLMQAVGGGSNEIERILIAIAGLGLPRP